MLKRYLTQAIQEYIDDGKVICIFGTRRVGKTTLLEMLKNTNFHDCNVLQINCDSLADRALIYPDMTHIRRIFDPYEVIIVDEAQKSEYIGDTMKLLVDTYGKSKKIFLTGSSSLDLQKKSLESLAGRKFDFLLHPLGIREIFDQKHFTLEDLKMAMVYGTYPEVINETSEHKKQKILDELMSSHVLRDILELQYIRNPDIVIRLLRLLAWQIGSEVSMHELAKTLGIDKNTVEKYISLLEKSFILYRLPPYQSNHRNALKKMNKIYFTDLGLRNSCISYFAPFDQRNDQGALWENFLINERKKRHSWSDTTVHSYFLRTYDQQEIDYIEEVQGAISAFEFKANFKTPNKIPKIYHTFDLAESYTQVNFETFYDFL